MRNSASERADAGDRAAQLNEQIAEGHDWANRSGPNGTGGDLHDDAAQRHRQAAGEGRSKAEAARQEGDD